jgi:putative transposase
MPRAARIIIPDMPHHVVQRGNRKQAIFASDQDRQLYLQYLKAACVRNSVRCLAWCLMDNHVHLVLTPPSGDALRAAMSSTHTRFAQWINASQDLSGHLFQGRYYSYAMDDAHLIAAARYVENNPVKAGLVEFAENWRWSSARAHIRDIDDGLTDRAVLMQHLPNWRAYLARGAEAAEQDEAIEAALLSGRPQGTAPAIAEFAPKLLRRGRPWPIKQPV